MVFQSSFGKLDPVSPARSRLPCGVLEKFGKIGNLQPSPATCFLALSLRVTNGLGCWHAAFEKPFTYPDGGESQNDGDGKQAEGIIIVTELDVIVDGN